MDESIIDFDLNEPSNDEVGVISFERNTFELNEYPKEIDCSSEDDLAGQKKSEDDLVQNVFDPFLGQCFLSEEEAYVCFQNYARRSGFSIRKDRTNKKNGEVRRQDFVCQCEGKPRLKLVDSSKEQRNKKSVRCGCKARIRITLKKSFDIFPQEWQITEFITEHNHELLSPTEVRFLPVNRKISDADEKRILLFKEAGLSVKEMMRLMEVEKKVKHGYLPFLEKDVRNLLTKIGKKHEVNDAMDLLHHCKVAKEENSKFQYAFTVDEERKLEHIFWSHALSFDWYQKFGDVVVFDTTYKVNAYQMPFGIFVGINNHGKTILFGCALLRNETTSAFRWLFKTFTALMKKQPKTILTDQDPWITQAIAKEFPTTKHSFCIWHITSKFSGWFTAVLQSQYQDWCADFYKLYHLDSPEEFEHQWSHLIAKYNMHTNKHVIGLNGIKHFWVPAYLRDNFFGGMTTTGRSESINAFIKRFIGSHSNLSQFVKQADLAIEDVQQRELHDTMLEKYRGSTLRTMSPLEEQARGVLTPFCFKKFQEEFGRATLYSLLGENGNEFIVKYHEETTTKKRIVFWDGEMATCSCKHFEFWGILCRHILSVFLHKDCYAIPFTYLPVRWSREVPQSEEAPRVLEEETLSDTPIDDIHCPPISKTKGRPKTKRLKGGKEARKVTKSCGFCKKVGHNITTCPEKENIGFVNGSQKKKKKTSSSDIGLNPIFSLKY
ncbi:protein FAR1-RELATED SEQUENCE 11-like isoform X2 [Rhododendron vialii]|nr:protein FAR1-RELATED SEQUENCE 11-like isoform X2 [Rhododendron vialii]